MYGQSILRLMNILQLNKKMSSAVLKRKYFATMHILK